MKEVFRFTVMLLWEMRAKHVHTAAHKLQWWWVSVCFIYCKRGLVYSKKIYLRFTAIFEFFQKVGFLIQVLSFFAVVFGICLKILTLVKYCRDWSSFTEYQCPSDVLTPFVFGGKEKDSDNLWLSVPYQLVWVWEKGRSLYSCFWFTPRIWC